MANKFFPLLFTFLSSAVVQAQHPDQIKSLTTAFLEYFGHKEWIDPTQRKCRIPIGEFETKTVPANTKIDKWTFKETTSVKISCIDEVMTFQFSGRFEELYYKVNRHSKLTISTDEKTSALTYRLDEPRFHGKSAELLNLFKRNIQQKIPIDPANLVQVQCSDDGSAGVISGPLLADYKGVMALRDSHFEPGTKFSYRCGPILEVVPDKDFSIRDVKFKAGSVFEGVSLSHIYPKNGMIEVHGQQIPGIQKMNSSAPSLRGGIEPKEEDYAPVDRSRKHPDGFNFFEQTEWYYSLKSKNFRPDIPAGSSILFNRNGAIEKVILSEATSLGNITLPAGSVGWAGGNGFSMMELSQEVDLMGLRMPAGTRIIMASGEELAFSKSGFIGFGKRFPGNEFVDISEAAYRRKDLSLDHDDGNPEIVMVAKTPTESSYKLESLEIFRPYRISEDGKRLYFGHSHDSAMYILVISEKGTSYAFRNRGFTDCRSKQDLTSCDDAYEFELVNPKIGKIVGTMMHERAAKNWTSIVFVAEPMPQNKWSSKIPCGSGTDEKSAEWTVDFKSKSLELKSPCGTESSQASFKEEIVGYEVSGRVSKVFTNKQQYYFYDGVYRYSSEEGFGVPEYSFDYYGKTLFLSTDQNGDLKITKPRRTMDENYGC